MEEKASTKISLSTFLLVIATIAIVIMGVFIYKLNNENFRNKKNQPFLIDSHIICSIKSSNRYVVGAIARHVCEICKAQKSIFKDSKIRCCNRLLYSSKVKCK